MPEIKGHILYDGDCGFCQTWVTKLAPAFKKRGFAVDNLQSDWVFEKINTTEEELFHDLHLLLKDGHRIMLSRVEGG